MPTVAVVGSGPAGLTVAFLLRSKHYDVTILEEKAYVGGRTRTNRFEEDHFVDTGAGWLLSSYREFFKFFMDDAGIQIKKRTKSVRGAADIAILNRRELTDEIDGQVHDFSKYIEDKIQSITQLPLTMDQIEKSTLFPPEQKEGLKEFLLQIASTQRADLEIDKLFDSISADKDVRFLGEKVFNNFFRVLFEGPFFGKMCEFNAAMVRTWLKALLESEFYQLESGMDSPWRNMAIKLENDGCNILLESKVEKIEQCDGKVKITLLKGNELAQKKFDSVIVAVPLPIARNIITKEILDHLPKTCVDRVMNIRYSPQVRIYLSRTMNENAAGIDQDFGIHLVPPSPPLATIERYKGENGAWGKCPANREWILLCASIEGSKYILDHNLSDYDTIELLYSKASRILQGSTKSLFPLEDCDIRDVHRWRNAVPIIEPGHYGDLETWITPIRETESIPVLAFCGDWMIHSCIEGAIRSAIVTSHHY